MGEIENLQQIKHREHYCRWCACELDFENMVIMREGRHIRWSDGVNRQEMFNFCGKMCQDAYHAWEAVQDGT